MGLLKGLHVELQVSGSKMGFVKSKIKGRDFASRLARAIDRNVDVKGQKDNDFRKKYRG